MRTIKAISTATTTTALPPPSPLPHVRSPWHSPVPYLFGGLAAMLGLIAFALLILACSYWRLSSRIDGDVESTGEEKEGSSEKLDSEKVYEEKILVIMAGEDKPTFLATPISSKTSLFSDKNQKAESKEGDTMVLGDNKGKVEPNDSHETTVLGQENRENHETTQQENH